MRSRFLRILGALLGLSLAATLLLLVMEGRWQEALPLHLCSVSALSAILLARTYRQPLMDFLWYLGMPGAALALLFPAPAVCACQMLMNLSYAVTHVLIVIIPVTWIMRGAAPRSGRVMQMMLFLSLLALAAGKVNRWLGTDFLFLSAPPAGTPLEIVYALGYPVYWLTLFAMMLFVCALMDHFAHVLRRWIVQ